MDLHDKRINSPGQAEPITLTKKEILAMEPGRELDVLVGKYVEELDLVEGTMPNPKYYMPSSNREWTGDVPHYSTDKTTSYVLAYNVQRVRGHNLDLASVIESGNNKSWQHIICKAALLAILNL